MSKTSFEKSNSWYNKLVGEKGHYYHQKVIIPKILEYIKSQELNLTMETNGVLCTPEISRRVSE